MARIITSLLVTVLCLLGRPFQAYADDIANHTSTTLKGSDYGTIANHSTIHLSGEETVTSHHVEDHCNISGKCKKLIIGSMADHVKICTTGQVLHGKTDDHCDITEKATENDSKAWHAENDRPGDPGN